MNREGSKGANVLAEAKLGNVASILVNKGTDVNYIASHNLERKTRLENFLQERTKQYNFKLVSTEELSTAYKFTLRYGGHVNGHFRDDIRKAFDDVTIDSNTNEDYIFLPIVVVQTRARNAYSKFSSTCGMVTKVIAIIILILLLHAVNMINKPERYGRLDIVIF